jgi:N-acetylglucosaminyldiphosphoundecaprenol N-acetyl-beta-D-mannosaminyltransferase
MVAAITTDWVGHGFHVGGVKIDAIDAADAAELLIDRRISGAIHLCNAYTMSLSSRDPGYASTLGRGSLNLADGMPLVWIARSLRLRHQRGRVYGPDLMADTLDRGRAAGLRHYLYGSSPEVMRSLVEAIELRWPGAEIVGAESPPYGDDLAVHGQAVHRLAASGADVIWVGLGTPKQDIVADAFAAELDIPVVAVGAAFDFIAGTKAQAPSWMRHSGLEWLFRLVTEPRRLWRRYLFGNSVFLWTILRRPPKKAI